MSLYGMMNLYKYTDAIERTVIPEMRRAFPDGGGSGDSRTKKLGATAGPRKKVGGATQSLKMVQNFAG